jgi:hypothetical protein
LRHRCDADVQENQDFLLTPERVQSLGVAHGLIPAGAWVAAAHRMERPHEIAKNSSTCTKNGAHSPAFSKECSEFLAYGTRRPGRRCRDRWNGRRAGRHLRSAVPQPQYDAWRRQIRHSPA